MFRHPTICIIYEYANCIRFLGSDVGMSRRFKFTIALNKLFCSNNVYLLHLIHPRIPFLDPNFPTRANSLSFPSQAQKSKLDVDNFTFYCFSHETSLLPRRLTRHVETIETTARLSVLRWLDSGCLFLLLLPSSRNVSVPSMIRFRPRNMLDTPSKFEYGRFRCTLARMKTVQNSTARKRKHSKKLAP